ncbi:protein CHROMATIN REMODELING 4-like [Apium graveolens]|uniref:protein CHROMATIN REMODELING 4-like n=1 Tax=Apium graveolens TaxID=4045 RepID=UPI003D7A0959
MKDNDSVNSTMINRNWVLKRKRGKHPYSPDTSNGVKSNAVPPEPAENASSILEGKSELTSHFSRKKKGNDGYFYECVVCDLGGNLLCCDSCPRTYHLQCLDPPLKRIPTGKWQCPTCSVKTVSRDLKNYSDPPPKRARTKIILKKSEAGNGSVDMDKKSSKLGSSKLQKNQLSGKGKSPSSHAIQSIEENRLSANVITSNKSSHLSSDGSAEDCSPDLKVDEKNLPELSPEATPKRTKSVSPAEASEARIDTDKNEEISEKKSGVFNIVESPPKELVPVLDAATRKVRKRKHKFIISEIQKKPKTGKKSCAINTSEKHGEVENSGSCQTKKPHLKPVSKEKSSSARASKSQRKHVAEEKSVSSQTSRPRRKHKEISHGAAASVLKNDIGTKIDIRSREKMVSEEPGHSESHAMKKPLVEPLIFEDIPPGAQQVDRVLGCRVSGSELNSLHCITVVDTHDLPAKTSVSSEDLNKISEKNTSSVTPIDGGAAVDRPKAAQDTLNQLDEVINVNKGSVADKINVYRRSMIKEVRDGGCVDSVTNDIRSTEPNTLNSKNEVISAASTEDQEKTAGKKLMGESTNTSSPDIDEVLRSPQIATPQGNEDGQELEVEVTTDCVPKTMVNDTLQPEFASSKGVVVEYEFLVKWVGKSHLHNSWISESHLKILSKRKLDNYKAKYGRSLIDISDERWKRPQRVIALQSVADGSTEVLVKWTALPYDECTWERLDEPVIARSSRLIDLFNQFECRAVENDATNNDSLRGKGGLHQGKIAPLAEQPKELAGGSLFPHQLEALNWLRKCWCKCRNVILADEMGLGKTVSAAAFLSSLYFEFEARLPCLVLVPLSTMPNWMSEFSLWAPDLNVVEYHGSAKARAMIRKYEWHASDPSGSSKKTTSYKFNVLLTTYEMVLVDSSHLSAVPWEVLVVDEGHRLKNSSSKLFGMLNTFKFQHRVLLTGTPLQNNIGEMYNLLHFLQPDSFPSLTSFEEKFNDLTTPEKVEELKKLVAPHMLRRLKKDVMQNIPPKTERMVPVELSSIQAEYYRAMLTKNYQILRNIGKGVAQQSMLNIVMQLRKVCNHPYLIQGSEPESGSLEYLHEMRIKASAKLTLLHSMLKVLHKEGHRVLIFSQMTKLLDILEDYLNIEFGPGTFERVDGSVSVSDRQTAINRFNQDKSRFVFLLSTRSCGLGINLATADTVIIYDSDFNPHADIQAMNRAHRIGQSNRLLVYRLVVRASVEERILQLAKKKLMLDQLFVNKSGSQKEVEDILRWGTEQLFNDSSSISSKDVAEDHSIKDETGLDIEPNRRRRTGALGDVYKDKCTDGSSKIVWDENAILKLLDRSNIQFSSPDNAEGDVENDMLGSVKSLEWNDEPPEEQEISESLAVVNDDNGVQHSEIKEDNVVVVEDNEWDRLLRDRWEKYQIEEEATLGRGKRQRKAVSYREAYAPHPAETPSEGGGGGGDEVREPEREYTPAGRAHKAKFAKLRARQKDRLSKRSVINASGLGSSPMETCMVPSSIAPGRHQMNKLDNQRTEDSLAIQIEGNKYNHNLEVPKMKPGLEPRPSKLSKHKMRSHEDFSVQGSENLLSNNNLLPVLGLCAPNANQMESSERNNSKSQRKKNKQVSRTGFPFDIAPFRETSTETDGKPRELASENFKLPSASLEALQHGQKLSKPDTSAQYSLPFPQGNGPDHLDTHGPIFSEFQEKSAFLKLPFHQKSLPKSPFPATNVPYPHPDLFPNLTLSSRARNTSDSVPSLPTIPLLPNLKLSREESSRYEQQGVDVNPMLGLGQMPQTYSSFPENHRKVLENIMMRTGSGPNNFFKRKTIKDIWTEDELDFLWIGVRRHGRGNWNAMVRDPRLKFSKFKTAEDLYSRWEEEQHKILDMPTLPVQKAFKSSKSAKTPLFPAISDAMMTRALHGSRFAGPTKFQPHLTDMKLGLNHQPSYLPQFEPFEQHDLPSERIPADSTWKANNHQRHFSGSSSVRPCDRPETSNLNSEQPFLLDMLGVISFGSPGLNCSNSFDIQKQEDELFVSRSLKRTTFLDKSLNILRESDNMGSGKSNISSLLADPDKEQNVVHSKLKDIAGSSSKNELPHWLREAVGGPAKPVSGLPPSVSAIAQSVRILYGDDNSTIPPFSTPALPPAEPKDPRRTLKKKKRRRERERAQKFKQFSPDIAGTSHSFQPNLHAENVNSTSVLTAKSPCPLIPQLSAAMPGFACSEASNTTAPSVNVPTPSSGSIYLHTQKKKLTETNPSSEVLQLVTSVNRPKGLDLSEPNDSSLKLGEDPRPPETSSKSRENNILNPDSVKQVIVPVSEHTFDEKKGTEFQTSVINQHTKEKAGQTESRNSSETRSDPMQPKAGETSSEGTVSDHCGSGQKL